MSTLELSLKLLDFLLKFPKQRVFGIFVDTSSVLDVLGAIGISQRANCFIVVVRSRTDVGALENLNI